jgi:hypothetical protein
MSAQVLISDITDVNEVLDAAEEPPEAGQAPASDQDAAGCGAPPPKGSFEGGGVAVDVVGRDAASSLRQRPAALMDGTAEEARLLSEQGWRLNRAFLEIRGPLERESVVAFAEGLAIGRQSSSRPV